MCCGVITKKHYPAMVDKLTSLKSTLHLVQSERLSQSLTKLCEGFTQLEKKQHVYVEHEH